MIIEGGNQISEHGRVMVDPMPNMARDGAGAVIGNRNCPVRAKGGQGCHGPLNCMVESTRIPYPSIENPGACVK